MIITVRISATSDFQLPPVWIEPSSNPIHCGGGVSKNVLRQGDNGFAVTD
jgi:hypothetical protein